MRRIRAHSLRHTPRNLRGGTVLFMICVMTSVAGLSSLAVDYGRVQLAKTELRRAADASARAAATAVGDVKKVQDLAVQFAAANKCEGSPIEIDKNQDVDFGDWDPTTRTFAVLSGSARANADAVRVTCRRTTNRQNAIPLVFGQIVGRRTCDVTASAIAAVAPQSYGGMIGLDYVKLSGNATASYWSSSGVVSGNAGSVASNGSITSSGSSTIHGTLWVRPGATVSGLTANATRNLPAPLSYPNGDSSPYSKTVNDNARIPPGFVNGSLDFSISGSKTVTIPAGNYVFHKFDVSGSAVVNFTGPVTIYYYENFNMSGSTHTSGNIPGNLRIVAIPKPDGKPPGSLNISGSGALYASIYAPQADITCSGTGSIYGSMIGKSITLSGSSDVYYDLSLPGSTSISLVK